MSKLLVIFGITGNQGGSLAKYVLNSPTLSNQFKIRGLTRDPTNAASQALSNKGIEMAPVDINSKDSLNTALKGAHTVFSMTNTTYDNKMTEYRRGCAIADAAVAQGADYLIWSSMTDVKKVTSGKLTKVDHFDVKAEVEQYIRTLPIKSAHYAPASFFQNFLSQQKPRKQGDGSFALENLFTSDTVVPHIDVAEDTGKFIAAILEEPEKYKGRFFAAATRLYSMREMAEMMSKVTGVKVVHKQISDEVVASRFPEGIREMYVQMFTLMRDYGYYGAETEELVEWTAKQARGELTEFEEFLRRVEYKLE